MAQPDEFYTFPDPSGRLVEFNPRTGQIIEAPNQPDRPIEEEERPERFGDLLATYDDVAAVFLRCLGRQPLSQQEAEGYGRFAITNDEVEREVCSSPESVAWRNRLLDTVIRPGEDAPTRNAPPPKIPDGPSEVSLDLLTRIVKVIEDATRAPKEFADELGSQINKKVTAVAPSVGRAVDDISRQVGQVVAGTIPSVLTQLGEAFGGIKSLLGNFLQAAATVADVAGAFTDAVKGNKDNLLGFVTSTARGGAERLDQFGNQYVIDAIQAPLDGIAAYARREV